MKDEFAGVTLNLNGNEVNVSADGVMALDGQTYIIVTDLVTLLGNMELEGQYCPFRIVWEGDDEVGQIEEIDNPIEYEKVCDFWDKLMEEGEEDDVQEGS